MSENKIFPWGQGDCMTEEEYVQITDAKIDQLQSDLSIVRESHKRQGELNDRLSERLKEAEKVIEFYGELDNWSKTNAQKCSAFICGDHEWMEDIEGFKAGAKARAHLKDGKNGT